MDGQLRRDGAHQRDDAEILDDDRVDAGRGARAHGALEGRELVVEDERVQRDVPAHAVLVEVAHRRREAGVVEVAGAGARVETLEAEVDGVGARAHRGAQRIGVAGGREDLGSVHGPDSSPDGRGTLSGVPQEEWSNPAGTS